MHRHYRLNGDTRFTPRRDVGQLDLQKITENANQAEKEDGEGTYRKWEPSEDSGAQTKLEALVKLYQRMELY